MTEKELVVAIMKVCDLVLELDDGDERGAIDICAMAIGAIASKAGIKTLSGVTKTAQDTLTEFNAAEELMPPKEILDAMGIKSYIN